MRGNMKTVYMLCATITLVGALPAIAAEQCSIHPTKGTPEAKLKGLAKVSQSEAQKTAIAKLDARESVSVASAELEAEHGCLIWSFDLRVAGKGGIQEVQVDAGNGNVLSVKHESSRQEAAETSKERSATAPK